MGSATFDNPSAGDIVNYRFIITNTGVNALSDIKLVDRLSGVIFDDQIKSTLAAGEKITVSGHYVLTEDDVSSSKTIKNVAIVTGKDPSGNELRATDDAIVEIIIIENPKTGSTFVLVLELLIIAISVSMIIFKNKIKKIGD